jgi:nicotinamidase-related amidase
MEGFMSKKTALLIIDAQVNMFAQGSSVFEAEKHLLKISQLIARARASKVPIIYVQNNGKDADPDIHGTPGWEIHPTLKPEKGDFVIQKFTPDSFHETNLQIVLGGLHIRHLVVAGMQTEYCINATVRRAHALGYDVILVRDAHSTYDGGGLTASQIITQYNDALRKVAKLKETINIAFE